MRRGSDMASGSRCREEQQEPEEEEEREEAALGKLVVRLTNVQEGTQLQSVLQTLEDLLALAHRPRAPKLFAGRNLHVPLLLVLDSYLRVAAVQQVGWLLLCKLIEVYPATLRNIVPQDVGKDWEVLGVQQHILKLLTVHNANRNLVVTGLKALNLLLSSDIITILLLDEDTDVFLLVFDALRTFPNNEEIQLYGCKILHMLFEKGT